MIQENFNIQIEVQEPKGTYKEPEAEAINGQQANQGVGTSKVASRQLKCIGLNPICLKMSSSSDSSSEPNLPSEEDDEEDVNPTNVFTQPEPIPKTQEFRGLLSDNGSTTTSGGSLSTTSSSSSSDNEHEFEDREDDPDMKLILSALDKTDSSTMKLQNKTFSDQKVRDIERTNSILMNRILSHNRRANRYTPAPRSTMISSSAVNRQKQQRQIDRDNLILLKKIQQVKPTVVNKQKR